jgi:predicted nucleic acid-binding protein
MTRGRRGSLALHRMTLSFTTPRRFSPAHKELHIARGAALWDALIIAACVDAGLDILYSEDVPGFDNFEGVRVINPFK